MKILTYKLCILLVLITCGDFTVEVGIVCAEHMEVGIISKFSLFQ
jgi:hypothetical protein